MRVAVAVALVVCSSSANGQLIYSFEDGTQGFGPNGFPLPTVAQDTIGATEGASSLLFSLGQNQTFSGALTQLVNSDILLNPETDAIAVDVTVTPSGEYTGAGFARMGISYFGAIPPNVFGVQVQTNGPSEQNVDLAPGTYTLTIPLISTAGEPIRNAFGGPGELTHLTGFQFYINKSADDDLTVYLDNVRAVPEPASALALGALAGLVLARRRR
jgi:hypothetical protein